MEQTNRTILFEEINTNKMNLLELIGDVENAESLTDDMIARIHQELVVHSYEEAVVKFLPTVYLSLDIQSCFCSGYTEKREVSEIEIPLYGKGGILEKLLLLMQKKSFGTYSMENISDLMENLFFEEYYEEFCKTRANIFYLCCYSQEEQATYEFEKLFDIYDQSMFLLITFIKEMQCLLNSSQLREERIILGVNFPTQIKAFAFSEEVKARIPRCLPEQKEKYRVFVQESINKIVQKKSVKNPEIIGDLLLLILEKENNVEKHSFDKYDKVLQTYISAVKRFWRKAKPLSETMLGIYEFFAQYNQRPVKEKKKQRMLFGVNDEIEVEAMEPVLLITNCETGVILQEKNKQRFSIYLETVNNKTYFENKIWYAIIPGIEGQKTRHKSKVRERFLTERETIETEYLSSDEVLYLVNLLAKSEIQCFLSLKTNGEAGFLALKRNGSEVFNEAFSFLEVADQKEYLVPAYPNFTIAPTSSMYYETISVNGERKRNWLTGIEIGASYIGAGIVAACQCPAYLSHFYGNEVDIQVPGVAYAFTKDGHEQITATTMKKELIFVDEEIIGEAIRHSRGMLFLPKGEKVIVATERVFSYRDSSKDTIFMIQTLSYLRRIIRYATQDFREERIKEFFENRPGSLKNRWSSKGTCVNAIIKKGEELKCNIDSKNRECTFIMEYIDTTKLDIVRIN